MGTTKDQAGGARQVKDPEWEMRRTGRGLHGLKIRNGKCKGSGGGARRAKDPNWEMQRTGWAGLTGSRSRIGNAKDRSRGGVDGVEPNIVEITHLCTMHGAHTSVLILSNSNFVIIFSDVDQ